MSDVVRSVVPATSSSRFNRPQLLARIRNSGNAFQIQVELLRTASRAVEQVGDLPVMKGGQSDAAAYRYRQPENSAHARVDLNATTVSMWVSLTGHIHGLTLGETSQK